MHCGFGSTSPLLPRPPEYRSGQEFPQVQVVQSLASGCCCERTFADRSCKPEHPSWRHLEDASFSLHWSQGCRALCLDLHALCLSDTISLFGNVDERGFQQFCIGENACLLLCVPQVLRGSGSPCHTSKFGPQNRLRCRSSIMTHRVEESETSHSISAVFPTGEPSPRKYRSEADWPGVEPRNTAWQRPPEKLRRFHGYDQSEGRGRVPVDAHRTG